MNEELKKALDELAAMKQPSVAALLHKHGYTYEAFVVERITLAYSRTSEKKPGILPKHR